MDFNLSLSFTNLNNTILAAGLAPGQFPGLGWFTNSIFFAIVVTLGVLLFVRSATSKMRMVPGKRQNFVELVIEFLYDQVRMIVGDHVAPRVFPLLATIFIIVLASNWAGLIPGVGTIGFAGSEEFTKAPLVIDHGKVYDYNHSSHGHGDDAHGEAAGHHDDAHGDSHHAEHEEGHDDGHHFSAFTPLLRPPTADMNFTLALACVFMVVWALVTLREVGIKGFIDHTFGVKGGLEGAIKFGLIPIFFFVGIIELISIAARPLSLSLRLFGNVYAGETLLHTMMEMGKNFGLSGIPMFLASVVLPFPFYFLELLVGILQATVFALLCAVFIKLSTAHEEH